MPQSKVKAAAGGLIAIAAVMGAAVLLAAPPIEPSVPAAAPPAASGLRVDLADGSWIIGTPAVDQFDVHTEHGDIHLKWANIRTIQWKAGDPNAQFDLANGDAVSGRMTIEKFDLKTLFGTVTVPLVHVRRLTSVGGSGGKLTLNLGGDVTMDLVLIRPGKFMMGPPGTQFEVTLSRPFYMGVTEMTQAQYEAVMGANTSNNKGATNPVDNLKWADAVAVVKKLAEKTGRPFRLPTEAEWEYACRAGTTTRFNFGDDESKLGDYAWYAANSGGTTHPVAQKKPNAWGLYDMQGNVWEYCSDWQGEYPKEAVRDPTGPATGTHHIIRGGSWDNEPGLSRSEARHAIPPEQGYINLGVRVVLPLAAEAPKP
jgi:formylglycine-generating enzyme required for sulfatase activity